MLPSKNILGRPLASCSDSPKTGFYRNGCCDTDREDRGQHTVCVELTVGFLRFSAARGNDLSTPSPEHGFPGLKAGDRWCLCAARWKEAYDAGVAPKVFVASTHAETLKVIPLDALLEHALDLN